MTVACALDCFKGDKPPQMKDVISTGVTLMFSSDQRKTVNDSAASKEMLNFKRVWWLEKSGLLEISFFFPPPSETERETVSPPAAAC